MEVNSPRSVLQSASWIAEHSKYVRIPAENVAAAARKVCHIGLHDLSRFMLTQLAVATPGPR